MASFRDLDQIRFYLRMTMFAVTVERTFSFCIGELNKLGQ